ncbi:MAG: urease accessory protein UreE [Amaricoccus sp.]
MTRLIARAVERAGRGEPARVPPTDRVVLDYEGRFLRRKTLTTAGGTPLFVDLAETLSLADGDAFVTETGARIEVEAAAEPLLEIHGSPHALARLAWHIGNRHMPAQIEPSRILIQENHVMADMLARLGAHTHHVSEPFRPEGGAYGHGRTQGHHHGGATDDPHGHIHD